MKEAKEQRVRRWQRPRDETVSVRAREEGARVQGGPVLSSFATTEIDQLKDDEKKGKQPGNGTQEPTKKTARDRDPRTREQTARDRDPRTCAKKQIECADEIICSHLGQEGMQVGSVCVCVLRVVSIRADIELEYADEWKWTAKETDWSTTPPTLKPTRSHSEGRWTSETNDTSPTNETGGNSTTRPMMEETERSTHSSPKQARESMFHAQINTLTEWWTFQSARKMVIPIVT